MAVFPARVSIVEHCQGDSTRVTGDLKHTTTFFRILNGAPWLNEGRISSKGLQDLLPSFFFSFLLHREERSIIFLLKVKYASSYHPLPSARLRASVRVERTLEQLMKGSLNER